MQYEICTCCGKPKRPKQQSKRFTSHLLLSHSLWCVPRGTKRVRGNKGFEGHTGPVTINAYGEYTRLPSKHMGDEDGMETVEAYECAPDCPIAELDRQSGVRKSGGKSYEDGHKVTFSSTYRDGTANLSGYHREPSEGGASRYFQSFPPDDYTPFLYQAKASRAERNRGCEDLPEQRSVDDDWVSENRKDAPSGGRTSPQSNHHPTVKPLALMRWLIRLITPPDGIVLDPFCGSGSTCVAAIQEGKHFIGIEQDSSYCDIANARIEYARTHEPDVRVQVATKKVKGTAPRGKPSLGETTHSMFNGNHPNELIHYADHEGMEEVEDWECAPDCPIRVIGEQSGERKSAYPGNPEKAAQQSHKHYEDIPTKIYGDGLSQRVGRMTSDTGTAARYFQQFPPDSLWCKEVGA